LNPGNGELGAALHPLPLPAQIGKVHDALALAPGKVLLATESGLRMLARRGSRLSTPPFMPPQKEVTALCQDRLGRVWLAGDGLWLVDGGKLHDAGQALPIAEPASALGADGEHEDGVVVCLRERGVAFVRAPVAGR
jgi:hypothetical protein